MMTTFSIFQQMNYDLLKTIKKLVRLRDTDKIIGFNTGCSDLYPNKKMSVGQHIFLINKLLAKRKYKVMLLGGPEDTERNKEIADYFRGRVINTPTNEGVRRGSLLRINSTSYCYR
ncbi:MAG: hypothetical protein MZV64_45410 [Ignavibacteriales bacterium]|nr:hypothetical protein [Ignavibacteriales bacterium]